MTWPEFEPVYPLTQGVTQKTMGKGRRGVSAGVAPALAPWIDPPLQPSANGPTGKMRLTLAHHPRAMGDFGPVGRLRGCGWAYDEFFRAPN